MNSILKSKIAAKSKAYETNKNMKYSFGTTSVSYLHNIFSSANTYRHMLLLSIPSILLLIYQSCLWLNWSYIIYLVVVVWCVCVGLCPFKWFIEKGIWTHKMTDRLFHTFHNTSTFFFLCTLQHFNITI